MGRQDHGVAARHPQLAALVIYTYVAVALVAAGIAFTSGWKVHAWKTDSEASAAKDAAAEVVRLKGKTLMQSTERNDRETTDRLRAAETSAAVARSDLERLRNEAAAAVAPDPGATGCPDDGRLERIAGLLAEGASLAEEGGRRVERLAAEKAGLQRHQSEVRRVLMNE